MNLGTPLKKSATKVMLLGSGELGKEVAIELIRLGVEVHACDSYPNAPAMQVAQFAHVFNMLDVGDLYHYIESIKPDYIVPEVEAIATSVLVNAEENGTTVIPSAKAVQLTMNREGIRRLAAEELELKTSRYKFASNEKEFDAAVFDIGVPAFVKPIMSSSGKGQSLILEFTEKEISDAWWKAQEEGRAGAGKVIVEECIDFDYEITLLTVRSKTGTTFLKPIGHRQVDGDYVESWQPQKMTEEAWVRAKNIATKITNALGGYGIFGVEMFVKGDTVYFSEVSPRPHDTGLVTIISQDQSEFELHAKALLGLPIHKINYPQFKSAASVVLKPKGDSSDIQYSNLDEALNETDVKLRLFGKQNIKGKRRMGVVVALDEDVSKALKKAKKVVEKIKITL